MKPLFFFFALLLNGSAFGALLEKGYPVKASYSLSCQFTGESPIAITLDHVKTEWGDEFYLPDVPLEGFSWNGCSKCVALSLLGGDKDQIRLEIQSREAGDPYQWETKAYLKFNLSPSATDASIAIQGAFDNESIRQWTYGRGNGSGQRSGLCSVRKRSARVATLPEYGLPNLPESTRQTQHQRIEESRQQRSSSSGLDIPRQALARASEFLKIALKKQNNPNWQKMLNDSQSVSIKTGKKEKCGNFSAYVTRGVETIFICENFYLWSNFDQTIIMLHELAHTIGVFDECRADLLSKEVAAANGHHGVAGGYDDRCL